MRTIICFEPPLCCHSLVSVVIKLSWEAAKCEHCASRYLLTVFNMYLTVSYLGNALRDTGWFWHQEPKALMVRWSQVSLAAGYLVELRPVNGGVPGGHPHFLPIPFLAKPSRIRTSIAAYSSTAPDTAIARGSWSDSKL